MRRDVDHHRAELLDQRSPADADRLAQLRADPALVVIDEVEAMRAELAELRPAIEADLADEPTRWAYYPWRHTLVHVLGPRGLRRLRLDRNRNKITSDEQARLGQLRVGVVGLSVGHAIAHALALQGLAGQLRLADFDEIEVSNLNRIPGSLLDVGVNKAVVCARRIAELDPYLDVVLRTEGITPGNIDAFLDGLDVVVEVCDSLDIKVVLREHARARRIPVLMETSDRGLLDVERFDLEPDRPLFHGLIDGLDSNRLAGLSTRDKAPYVLRMVEGDLLSDRLAASMAEIDRTLSSWPQLGGDVLLGAASLAAAVRRFGLGEPLPSGRVRVDLDSHLTELADPPVRHRAAQPPPVPGPPPSDPVELVADAANRAPSGGNVQPWRFEVDGDELRFRLRAQSPSGLDLSFRGSLLALGAAALNARVAAASIHRLGPLTVNPTFDPAHPVATLQLTEGSDPDLARLRPAIYTRATNRRPGEPVELDPALLQRLKVDAEREGGVVHWTTDRAQLSAIAEVLAESDRIRNLTPHLHSSMMAELRWPDRDPLDTGLDVRTLELDDAELAKLTVGARADVMARLAEWDAGQSLGDGTRFLVNNSAALVSVTIRGSSPQDYFIGGATMERLWLAADGAGIALHPVSPVFVMAVDDADLDELVGERHRDAVRDLARRLRQLLAVPDDEQYALVLRASRSPEPTVRSGRRPLSEALRRGTP